MPPMRARKPGLLNRQFGFPEATGKQKNPAFAFVLGQGKNKRRIFWFRKQTNHSFAKRKSQKNSSWSGICRPPVRTNSLSAADRTAPLRHPNKSKNPVNVAKINFYCPIIPPPFKKGPTLFKNRANQSDESLTPAFSATWKCHFSCLSTCLCILICSAR